MRVEGNAAPERVFLETCGTCPGMAELRLRENVVSSGESGPYRYDEYVLRVPDHPGLYEAVLNDQDQWFATARNLEAGERSSFACMLQDGLEAVIPGSGGWQALEMAQAFNQELKEALQLVFDTLNQGQQQKLLKDASVKALLQRYGIGEDL